MDARIARAQVSRVSFSFTLDHLDRFRRIGTGNRAASVLERALRSLALRPRLATGLPWTDDPRRASFALERTLWAVARTG
jgi:hypothetical protein